MQDMYTDRRKNSNIFLSSAVVFAIALWLLRSQALIDDVSWMKSMIPHHSIAILTSERANLTDPRTQDLANRIIESQREEIEEMKVLIEDIGSKKKPIKDIESREIGCKAPGVWVLNTEVI